MKTAPESFALAALAVSDGFREALLDGLSRTPKAIPCKYFYDLEGARLFEESVHFLNIIRRASNWRCCAGMPPKSRHLPVRTSRSWNSAPGQGRRSAYCWNVLQRPRAYIPVDISANWLGTAATQLRNDYPGLEIHPLASDFAGELRWPISSRARRLGFFPGSTIGNFRTAEAREFLVRTGRMLRQGALLIGVDLVKDPAILHAAYNDAEGVTAAFNRNLLQRANREAGADFDVSRFAHYALYNPVRQRIEMYLISMIHQEVTVCGRSFPFAEGEAVLTEYSYKYTIGGFQDLAVSAGFTPRAVWCDDENLFSLHWLDAP